MDIFLSPLFPDSGFSCTVGRLCIGCTIGISLYFFLDSLNKKSYYSL